MALNNSADIPQKIYNPRQSMNSVMPHWRRGGQPQVAPPAAQPPVTTPGWTESPAQKPLMGVKYQVPNQPASAPFSGPVAAMTPHPAMGMGKMSPSTFVDQNAVNSMPPGPMTGRVDAPYMKMLGGAYQQPVLDQRMERLVQLRDMFKQHTGVDIPMDVIVSIMKQQGY